MALNTILNSLLLGFLVLAGTTFAEEDYLESISGGVRLKVGLVDIQSDAPLQKEVHELQKLLVFDLDKDGRTKVLSKDRVDPMWVSLGVQFYIHGKLLAVDKNKYELELNISDMYSGLLLKGKRYKIAKNQLRQAGHDFTDEALFQMYGEYGIASTKILYVKKSVAGKNIYSMDYDGMNGMALTSGDGINTFPVLGPENKSFFYTSFAKGYPTIVQQNFNSRHRKYILAEGTRAFGGHLSQDGKFLSYTGQTQSNSDLYTYELATGKTKKITDKGAAEISPFWFPGGGQIAYSSDRGGNPQIYVLDLLNNESNRVTFYGKYNESPAVSPLGDKLAYCSMDEGRFNIYVLDLLTGEILQLTANQGDNENPYWSPDGRMIVFSSTRSGQSDIYIMRENGTGVSRITYSGANGHPRWSHSSRIKENLE